MARRRLVWGVGAGAVLFAGALGLALYVIGPTGGNSAQACETPRGADEIAPFATGEVAAFITHEEAETPPAIAFVDETGAPKTLADWAGRVVLLNVWATWCAPCRAEMPMLDDLEAEYGGESFEVVAVSIDAGDAQKPKDFLAEVGADDLAFYHDPTTDTFSGLRAAGRGIGLPVTLLIDGHGCELGYLAGPADWASGDAIALVEAALGRR